VTGLGGEGRELHGKGSTGEGEGTVLGTGGGGGTLPGPFLQLPRHTLQPLLHCIPLPLHGAQRLRPASCCAAASSRRLSNRCCSACNCCCSPCASLQGGTALLTLVNLLYNGASAPPASTLAGTKTDSNVSQLDSQWRSGEGRRCTQTGAPGLSSHSQRPGLQSRLSLPQGHLQRVPLRPQPLRSPRASASLHTPSASSSATRCSPASARCLSSSHALGTHKAGQTQGLHRAAGAGAEGMRGQG